MHLTLFTLPHVFSIFLSRYTSSCPVRLILSFVVFILPPASSHLHPLPSPLPFLFILRRKVLVAQPACRCLSSCAGMSWWHCCVLFLFLFTNRRRPNWSMPALRSLNRACSLKRPKLTNSRGS